MKLIATIFCLFSLFATYASGWFQQADFGGIARHRTTCLPLGNKIYMGLGHYNGAGPNILFDDWWEYDPAANAWTQKASYLGGECYHAAAFAIDDIGYVGTGRTSASGNTLVQDFFKYEPTTNTWTQLTDFPGTARRGGVGFSIGNYGYMGIGSDASDMYRYNPANNQWVQIASVPGGNRMSAVAFSIGNSGYVGTGELSSTGMASTDFYKYDPPTNSWTPIADVGIDPFLGPIPRMEAAAFAVNGRGYVLTGDDYSSGNNFKDMWEYVPATNTWSQIEDFEGTARRFLSATALNGFGYVGLGTNGTNFKDFWRFDATLSLIERNMEFVSIQAYPNPAQEKTHIQVQWPDGVSTSNVHLVVTNLFGERIAEKTFQGESIELNTQNWASGIYLYSLQYDHRVLKTGKLTVL